MLVATIELSEAKSNYTSKRKAINSYKLSVETKQPMKKRRVIIS